MGRVCGLTLGVDSSFKTARGVNSWQYFLAVNFLGAVFRYLFCLFHKSFIMFLRSNKSIERKKDRHRKFGDRDAYPVQ